MEVTHQNETNMCDDQDLADEHMQEEKATRDRLGCESQKKKQAERGGCRTVQAHPETNGKTQKEGHDKEKSQKKKSKT